MTTLFEEYFRQRSDVVEASQSPRTVVFNQAGFFRAMKEAMPDSNHFNLNPGDSSRTYCGLPYMIDRDQRTELVVTHETESEVQERIRNGRRGQMSVKLSVDMSDAKKTIAEIIGSKLSKPQLSDLIISFVESQHPDERDPFSIELRAVVERHGSFE